MNPKLGLEQNGHIRAATWDFSFPKSGVGNGSGWKSLEMAR